MLSLDSPRWWQLQHAYGDASDIPALLRQLETLPGSKDKDEPWFSLWSALAHQGDVYSATFAAVPHVVSVLRTRPEQASFAYFQFPAWVEVCRHKKDVPVPPDLEADYFAALRELPALIARASSHEWDVNMLVCALSALAAAKGFPSVAEAAQELTPEVANDFLEWFFAR